MRFKFDREDPNEYRCCFCCHVRTGTILLGLWHLLMHMFVLSLIAMMMIHPEVLENKNKTSSAATDTVNVYLNGYDDPNNDNGVGWFQDRKWNHDDKVVGFLITICSLMITMMLVYGSIKGRPGYLMPFFCLQVFDFCIACLSVVCYFSYMPNIKQWIREQDNLLMKEQLLNCNEQWLMLLVVTVFVLVMSVKAYLIGVVWACYKFLTRRNLNDGVTSYMDHSSSDTEMLLPPKYEDAIKYPQNALLTDPNVPPPPPYTAN